MKRLIFLLAIALVWAMSARAQVITFRAGQTYASYTGTAADTAEGTTAKNFDIFLGKDFMYYYDVAVTADSSGDGSNFSVQLSGSNDNTNWYTIGDAVTWYLTSSVDTVIRFTNASTVTTSTTIAAATDYHDIDYPLRYEYHDLDTAADGGAVFNDTVTVPAFVTTDTVTIGARTITETLTEPSVGWRYLRVGFTGAGADAHAEIEYITVAIRPKLFQF